MYAIPRLARATGNPSGYKAPPQLRLSRLRNAARQPPRRTSMKKLFILAIVLRASAGFAAAEDIDLQGLGRRRGPRGGLRQGRQRRPRGLRHRLSQPGRPHRAREGGWLPPPPHHERVGRRGLQAGRLTPAFSAHFSNSDLGGRRCASREDGRSHDVRGAERRACRSKRALRLVGSYDVRSAERCACRLKPAFQAVRAVRLGRVCARRARPRALTSPRPTGIRGRKQRSWPALQPFPGPTRPTGSRCRHSPPRWAGPPCRRGSRRRRRPPCRDAGSRAG